MGLGEALNGYQFEDDLMNGRLNDIKTEWKACLGSDKIAKVQTPDDVRAQFKLLLTEELPPNLVGYTDMDNFDFVDFLVRIGVPREAIQAGRYDDDCEWEADEDA